MMFMFIQWYGFENNILVCVLNYRLDKGGVKGLKDYFKGYTKHLLQIYQFTVKYCVID